MAYDLSILIPARNEMFLAKTVEDILQNIRGNTEILVALDGAWANPALKDDRRLTIIYFGVSQGQRAATNRLCEMSRAKYVMKIDAHCAVDRGFDVKMMEEMQDDYTMIPTMYNLHGFDWVCPVCKNRTYQGPTPQTCFIAGCKGKPERDVIWKPRLSRKSDFYRFDTTLHFQYHGARKAQVPKEDVLVETMSAQGSCFMLTRDKYWELNICDEKHGSWGQQGTEIACKTWLSGGRLVTNRKTWYSHMFRTQGGDFSFPYPQSGRQVEQAREYSKKLFLENTWEKQIHPLSWLIEKFKPLPDWHETSGKEVLEYVNKKGEEWKETHELLYFRKVILNCIVCGKDYSVKPSREEKSKCCSMECLNIYKSQIYTGRKLTEEWKNRIGKSNTGENHGLWRGDNVGYKALHDWVRREKGKPILCEQCGSINTLNWANKSHRYRRDINDWIALCKKCHYRYDHLTRSIIYYTDNKVPLKLGHRVRQQILRAGLPIVSVSHKPMNFGDNYVYKGERGYLAYHEQILMALEKSTAEIIYFCEHDVFYDVSHFEFTPLKNDVYYYDFNFWRVRADDRFAIHYDTHQVNLICAYRELLLKHYREKVKRIKETGFTMRMGFEPGCNRRAERIDDYKAESYFAENPSLDIRHGSNLTRSRWSQSEFRNKDSCKGWKEVKDISEVSNLFTV